MCIMFAGPPLPNFINILNTKTRAGPSCMVEHQVTLSENVKNHVLFSKLRTQILPTHICITLKIINKFFWYFINFIIYQNSLLISQSVFNPWWDLLILFAICFSASTYENVKHKNKSMPICIYLVIPICHWF